MAHPVSVMVPLGLYRPWPKSRTRPPEGSARTWLDKNWLGLANPSRPDTPLPALWRWPSAGGKA